MNNAPTLRDHVARLKKLDQQITNIDACIGKIDARKESLELLKLRNARESALYEMRRIVRALTVPDEDEDEDVAGGARML